MEEKIAKISDISCQTFDFVIIGGGVAGCVLASRLSENPAITVALLEAGGAHFEDPLITVPDGWMKQMLNPEYDWVFRTTRQKRAKNAPATTSDGKPDESFYWSRGKGLGGSSCMNFAFWMRPQKEEIDALEKLGNPGWTWKRFFEASKRSESFLSVQKTNCPEFRGLYKDGTVGTSGPVPISFSRTVSGTEVHFQEALAETCGVAVNENGLSGQLLGTWKTTSSIDPRSSTRSTAASGYLIPVLDRPNLKVLTNAYVHRILITTRDHEVVASGVEFEHGGAIHLVNVAKEVLLTASTVKSPHILELSGIGDRKVLEPLGIPVQVDLPSVGTNLQDHLIAPGLVYEMKPKYNFVTSETITLPEIQKTLRGCYGEDSGPLYIASTGVTFLPLQTFSDRYDKLIRATENKFAEVADTLPNGLMEQLKVQLEMLKNSSIPDIEIVVFPFNIRPEGSPKPLVGIFPSIGHPFSRGTIHTSSNDPRVQPTIEPNYLAEEIDFEILLDSLKFVRKVCGANAWQAVCKEEVSPGPSVVSDEDLREHLKEFVSTIWHSCGSCSMLPKEKGGVVDNRLKVYGTKNIRVADLSILPMLTAVHTQATTYAIAEQAVDIIKEDYGL